jgi:outer membrane protein assembly factor BamB/orotate phosphoribosyltransferase
MADVSTVGVAAAEPGPDPGPNLAALARLIRERAIVRRDQGWIVAPNGAELDWLLDLKQIFLVPEALQTIAAAFWQRFAPLLPFQIGGLETAAIPLITALLLEGARRGTPVNGFIVRKERKTSGIGKRIEGRVGGEPIVIVDDILNSAHGAEMVRAILESHGRRVDAMFVVVDFEAAAGVQWRVQYRIPVETIFRLEHFGLALGKRPAPAAATAFKTVWRHDTPGGNHTLVVPKSSPVLDDRAVYFGTDSGRFWALDQADGKPLWHADVVETSRRGVLSCPALHAGRVYYGGYDGNVYARDAASGAELWRYGGADWVGASPVLAPRLDLLFIGLEHAHPTRLGSVVALRLGTGAKVWEHDVPDYIHGTPAFCDADGVVAIGTNGGQLLLLRADTGERLWQHLAGGPIKQAPAFDPRRRQVVSGGFDGAIRVHDAATGAVVWNAQTADRIYSSPLIVDDRAFVASTDKHLYVLDLVQRRVVQRLALGAKSFATPRAFGSSVFVGCNSGKVWEFDIDSLKPVGTYQLPDCATCAVAHNATTGRFFTATHMNSLYCFARVPAPR